MRIKDITPGDKIGKALAARIITSKKGTEAIEVAFAFEEPSTGTTEHLSWQAWLTDRAIENSMETLRDVLGYNGSADTDAAGNLTDKNVLDFSREVRLVVELETNPESQKTYPKIKWVNTLGGSGYQGVTVQASTKSKIQAAFLAAKQKGGAPAAAPRPAQQQDIPF